MIVNEKSKQYLTSGQVAKILGITKITVNTWAKKGKLNCIRLPNGYRGFLSSEIYSMANNTIKNDFTIHTKKTICYVRVSSIEQSEQLDIQAQTLSNHCTTNKWVHEIIRDYGSGLDYDKKGIRKLIDKLFSREYNRLVVANKDVLARFGSEFIFAICERLNIEVVVLNAPQTITHIEKEFKTDIIEVMKTLNKRLYGEVSPKIKKAISDIDDVLNGFLLNDDLI